MSTSIGDGSDCSRVTYGCGKMRATRLRARPHCREKKLGARASTVLAGRSRPPQLWPMFDLADQLARTIGDRYRIERELGRGGMGVVLLAHDVKLDRPVAIKALRPDAAHPVNADRFLREIRIAAQLQHPNILSLIDSGETDGIAYFVMPYVPGESLRERLLREKQLS